MTTELEKQFFDTFGIKEKELEYPDNFTYYPEITDKHYLELICVLGYFETVHNPNNCEELKKYILDYYLNLDNSEIRELKYQVQAIFEGD
jgi:hypothetical protein